MEGFVSDNQTILGLDVSMNDSFGSAVTDRIKELKSQ